LARKASEAFFRRQRANPNLASFVYSNTNGNPLSCMFAADFFSVVSFMFCTSEVLKLRRCSETLNTKMKWIEAAVRVDEIKQMGRPSRHSCLLKRTWKVLVCSRAVKLMH